MVLHHEQVKTDDRKVTEDDGDSGPLDQVPKTPITGSIHGHKVMF